MDVTGGEMGLGPSLARGLCGTVPLHLLCLVTPPSVGVVVHHSPPPVQKVPVGSGRQGSHAVADAQDHLVVALGVIVPLVEWKVDQLAVGD